MAEESNIKINDLRVGMNLDSSPQDIAPSEWTLAANANISSADAYSIKIQNESSNFLCSIFKEGYKVIGKLYINTLKTTIFFLVNPTTQQSEIGKISNLVYDDFRDRQINCKDCSHPLIEDKPLETIIQTPLCNYETIVNANCLNFNINNPIDTTYEIGVDINTGLPDCDGITIFFTDNLNPRRFINLNNFPKKLIGYSPNCDVPIYNNELDCERIKVDASYFNGCIIATDVVSGGQNQAGVYQFVASYSNINGNEITDFFTVSNPISIFDAQRSVTTKTDYITGQAIKISISNLDTEFQWINLVVIKTINGNTQPYLIGTFPINSTSFVYTYTGANANKELVVTINQILSRKTLYDVSLGVTSANNQLFWYNLKEQRIINLQPAVNKLKLQWQTIEANEGFYIDGANVANYTGYERDEIYAFGIEFRKNNGYKLPTFLISAQDANYYNVNYNVNPFAIIDSDNPDILTPQGCDDNPLNQLWQVYNIAQNLGTSCGYIAPSGNNTTYQTTEFCSVNYNDGESPVPCCPTTNVNYVPLSCSPSGSPTLVHESITTIINTYNNSPTILPPICLNDMPLAYNPSGCGVNPSGNASAYVPPNTTCFNAYTLYTSQDSTCPNDPQQTTTISHKPTVFFTHAPSGTPSPLGSCASPTDVSTNVTWYSFTAVNSIQAITIATFGGIPVTIVAYDGCPDLGGNEIGCSKNGYLILGEQSPLTDISLVLGNTYYFAVYSPDPTFGTTGYLWDWGTICLNVPTATGTTTVVTPAVYNQVYSYRMNNSVTNINSSPCYIQTFQHGEFSYWQSSAKYPSNPDVWGELCGQPIKHHKFPDSNITHIHNQISGVVVPQNTIYGQNNKIYPIGVKIDVQQIKNILQDAVDQGLITDTERLEITGYSIKRSERRGNRSVVAKGLLYDVWNTPQLYTKEICNDKNTNCSNFYFPIVPTQSVYYSNYPFNDLNPDPFLKSFFLGPQVSAPYIGAGDAINGRYTFHSPNTSFNRPFLITGQELKLETTEFGQSFSRWNEVEKHSKYVLLTLNAYIIAGVLAAAQIILESWIGAVPAGDLFTILGTGPGVWPSIGISFAILEGVGIATNGNKYVTQWADIFKKNGTPRNFAMYYTAIGKYNQFHTVPNNPLSLNGHGRKRASIVNSRYLNSGNTEFFESGISIRFNNFERESSVYLAIDAFDIQPINPTKAFKATGFYGAADESRLSALYNFTNVCTENVDGYGPIASFYASIKNYIPDQYGTPDQIEWIDTGYCGIIDWNNSSQSTNCDTIFGGDTFINRFALKRKMPFFLQDRVGNVPDTDIFYRELGNVALPNYFFNSLFSDTSTASSTARFFGQLPPDANFLCSNPTKFYQKGYMPWAMYGVPYYICESDYNVDLRHGEDELAKNFYPWVGDVVNWTQQYQVPISTDNYYFYNTDYSKQNKENFYYTLKQNFNSTDSSCQVLHPTRVIYSPQQVPFWLDYLGNDYYDFPREDGDLVSLTEMEQDKILVRSQNANKIFNAFVQINTGEQIAQLSTGAVFSTKPLQVYKTDLGFGGSVNRTIESTPFGTFYVDTVNPSILNVTKGKNVQDNTIDISQGHDGKSKIKMWLRENLPFQIIKDYPDVEIDNAYKYFGIATAWDNKYDRLFITKRDARVRNEFKNSISYNTGIKEFQLRQDNGQFLIVSPLDSNYFCDKSFTIAYSPIIQEFISFYSFTPNYYLSSETYFSSGINFSEDITTYGLWHHGISQKSNQVFYGKLHPYILEYSVSTPGQNKILDSIKYNHRILRYQDNLNYSIENNITYNHALIYNDQQCSGDLTLIPTEKNNLFQLVSYPKDVLNSRQILVENNSNWYSFNSFFDISRQNSQPFLQYECRNAYKTLNELSINHNYKYLPNRMSNTYFVIRLENNKYSNYRFIHNLGMSQEGNTET